MMRLMKKCKYCGLILVSGLNMFLDLFEFSNTRLIIRNRLQFLNHFHSFNRRIFANSGASGSVKEM